MTRFDSGIGAAVRACYLSHDGFDLFQPEPPTLDATAASDGASPSRITWPGRLLGFVVLPWLVGFAVTLAFLHRRRRS
jgi:hypothetical protein